MRALISFLFAGLLLPSAAMAGRVPPEGHVDRWYTHASPDAGRLPDKFLGNEVFYQVFLDRFANGNPANDCLYEGRFCDPTHRDWYSFWGGDLRGLIGRIPYLKRLGVTKLWITPIFDNQMVKVARNRHGQDIEVTAYHGYWPRDWYRLNPVFTDHGNQDFGIVDELIRVAGPEIQIVLDTVANHTNPSDPTAESLAYLDRTEPLTGAGGLTPTHRGALFRDGRFVTSLDLDQQVGGSNPAFHWHGPIQNYDDPYQLENFQLDGLTDLRQDNSTVRAYVSDAHDFWLRRFPGLAGYRMDTIKHVPHSYWLEFDRDFQARQPGRMIVGEYYGAGPSNAGSAKYYRETHQTMFDFQFRGALFDVLAHGRPMSAITSVWAADPALLDARHLVTFVDNHDLPRGRGLGLTLSAMRQALALMFFSRGVPSVYYGLEQDLFHPGDPGDPYNRPMMERFDESSDLFLLTRALSGIRRGNPALRWGKTHVVHESRHILAFERVLDGRIAFLAISANPITGSDDFEIQGLTLPDGAYRDALSGLIYQVRGGRMPVRLKQGDIIAISSAAEEP